MKSILCIFNGSQHELNAVDTSFVLSKTFNAQVRFLHISPNLSYYPGMYEGGVDISPQIIAQESNNNEEIKEKARQYIFSFSTKHHVPLDGNDPMSHHPFAQFISRKGEPENVLSLEGVASDIVVIARNNSETSPSNDDIIIAALFNTGRPVLLLPPAHRTISHEWEDKIISVAWDGSLESARAIFNAMPILERTEKIYIITAGDNENTNTIESQNSIIEYFHAHNLRPNHVMLTCKKHHAGEVLLNKAKELGSNLLVMGAYGHSRFREIITGGFTRYMLENSDIPILLSH